MSESRILVVDDEKELAESMLDLLEHVGYTVEWVGTGERALERIGESYPDLVVLDIKLPGIDGIEVLQRTKKIRPSLPIVIVSASSQKGTRDQAQDYGADEVLLKPFDEDELLEIIRNLLERG